MRILFANQVDDEYDWQVIKPEVYATIMDFYASGQPILTEEQPSSDTGIDAVWNSCLRGFHAASIDNAG